MCSLYTMTVVKTVSIFGIVTLNVSKISDIGKIQGSNLQSGR